MDVASSKNAMIIERDRRAKILIFACMVMYMLMMGSKNVYTAELVVLQDVFNASKPQVSLAMTYYFITYAIGQFVLSSFYGKINLKIYLTTVGLLSAFVTIFLGLSKTLDLIYLLCAVNGVLQAGIYSGCMATLSKYVPNKMLPFANKIMTAGTIFYGVVAYGTPALFVGQGLWNVPFILLGIIFVLSALYFFYCVQRMKKFPNTLVFDDSKIESSNEKVKPFIEINTIKGKVLFLSFMVLIALLGNVVFYIVNSWLPDMLYDVYAMPKENSLLITLSVTLIGGLFSIYAITLCEKYKNIIWVSVGFYVICVVAMGLLVFVYDKNVILSMILVAVFLGASGGGRAVYGGVMAFKMNSVVNTGSYLALTNGMAAVMAGVIPPLAGMLIEAGNGIQGYGNSYLLTTIILAVFLTFLIIFAVWYKFKSRKTNNV